MLSTIVAKRDALMAKFSKVNVNDIQDAELRGKAKTLKAKQGGFTLLELLVVVAILAAIAGTATISLSEAEKQTRSGLHASMMDGLTKALHTFPVLNKGEFPGYLDSLVYTNAGATALVGTVPHEKAAGAEAVAEIVGTDSTVMQLSGANFGPLAINAELLAKLTNAGLNKVMALDASVAECQTTATANTLADNLREGTKKINNLFRPTTDGCGKEMDVQAADVLVNYKGKYQALMGINGKVLEEKTLTIDAATGVLDPTASASNPGAPITLALGLGPSATLFDPNTVGGMTATPNYRGGNDIQYNRFIGLFQIGEVALDFGADEVLGGGDDSDVITPLDVKFLGVVTPQGNFIAEELDKYNG